MWQIQFGTQDLLRITVAPTPVPVWETITSLGLLHRDERLPEFMAWRRAVRVWGLPELGVLSALASGPLPELVRPTGPAVEFAAELDEMAVGQRERRALEGYHRAAVAPFWDSMTTAVAVEVRHWQEVLTRQGIGRLLAALHPRVRWHRSTLEVCSHRVPEQVRPAGRGLVIQPSVFCRQPVVVQRPVPTLVLPVALRPDTLRHSGGQRDSSGRLPALLGPTRALALEAATGGCTTTELARRCGVSLSAASTQAMVLRQAGLITTRRFGPTVRHEITCLGTWLLAGIQP